MTPQTAYDTLALRPNATQSDIEDNYSSLIARLKTQKNLFKPGDYALKLQTIQAAFDAISTPDARMAYDSQLARRTSLAVPAATAMRPDDATSLALRAEAVALRAEAIALRADALSAQSAQSPHDMFARRDSASAGAYGHALAAPPLLKRLAMLLGTAVAIWMVVQVAYLLMTHRKAPTQAGVTASAREKVIVQEYEQTHGVRPGSATEAELMEAANRRRDLEVREARLAEREKAKISEEERRFEETARRRADQVSAELNRSESMARDQARRDDEQKERQIERQKQAREDAERLRIEREQARWQNILRR